MAHYGHQYHGGHGGGDGDFNAEIYDLYNDKILPRRNENPPITRLFYSILAKENQSEVLENNISEFIQETNYNNSENGLPTYSGFLLLQGNFGVHFIENEEKEIEYLLKYLKEEVNKEDGVVEKITVLACNEENYER